MNGYKCPECSGATVVYKTDSLRSHALMRRRKCLCCSYRFKTLEIPMPASEKATTAPVAA